MFLVSVSKTLITHYHDYTDHTILITQRTRLGDRKFERYYVCIHQVSHEFLFLQIAGCEGTTYCSALHAHRMGGWRGACQAHSQILPPLWYQVVKKTSGHKTPCG